MTLTYQAHKAKTTSEKIVLAWLEPSQRLFSWSVYSGSVYSRSVSYYVSGVRQDSTALTSVSSLAAVTSAGKWFFDASTKTLYVWSTGDADPGSLWTDVTYRLFFSNAPIDLPADLASGEEVPYDARIQKTGKFTAGFDPDQKGIALEGSGSLTLHNNDDYFGTIYDRLIWENKDLRIFSYARGSAPSEALTLFRGVVTNKDFEDTKVTFKAKDFVYKLRTALDLPRFEATDGSLPDSLIGKPKRRIYGRVDGLVCEPISTQGQTYEPQQITADARNGTAITFDLTSTSNKVTASSTDIHKDVCAGDVLKINGTSFKVKSLARLDIGLDTPVDVTFSRTSDTVFRLAFTGIDTSLVSVGDHVTIATLSNGLTATKTYCIGHFPVATVNASYLEFTWPTSVATMATDTFKSGVGEIAVTRHTNTTAITVQQASTITASAAEALVTPAVPYRRFNRDWYVAHHALSTKATTITSVISAVKFALADVDGVYEGDVVRIAGSTLSTITGLDREARLIEVADVVLPLPVIADTVERLGVQRVTSSQDDFTQFTDFSPAYDSSLGATLEFTTLAEFNAATTSQLSSRVSWYNGSKQVLGFNGIFRDLKVRDWVASATDSVWYEISEKFSDNVIILNTPYTGTGGSNLTYVKQPVYLKDTSVVIAEVYGRTVDNTESGTFISTGAAVVKDLLADAGVDALADASSFTEAGVTAPYLISLALPYSRGTATVPKIRDILNRVNDSVQGSLYTGIDGSIKYRVLDASRTLDDAIQIDDGDLLEYSVDTDSSTILSKVLTRYADRDADVVTEAPTYNVEQSESTFVLNSGIASQVDTVQVCLYNAADADLMAQRIRFIHELSSSQLSVTVKLLLADASLNDLVTVELDRMYARMGTTGTDRTKTGLISSISKDGITTQAVVDDLGNIFNRVAVISANDSPAFSAATESERRFSGYITDNDGLNDTDETTFNTNLIG